MSSTTTVTLSDLIEQALNVLHQESERPLQVTVGSNALDDTTDTTFTVSDADRISTPTLLEHGQELMLCVAKSTDPTPVLTVIRGYAGTPKAVAATGDVILVEPTWSRYKVRNAILTCFRRTLNAKLPALTTAQMAPVVGKAYVEMPANTVDVNRVFYQNPVMGEPIEVSSWDFYDDVAGASSTTKLLSISRKTTLLTNFSSNLYVTYQTPYTWSAGGTDPAESATIALPLGAEDLPCLYAAAYVLLNREMSRIQMDRTEEWTTEASVRGGISMRLVQQSWSNFYSALDEARSIQNVPRRIRYRTRRSL